MEKTRWRTRKASELLTEDQSKRFQGKDREKQLRWRKERIQEEGKERKGRRKGRKTYEVRWKRETPSRWKVVEGREREKRVKREELEIRRKGGREEKEEGTKEWRRKLEEEVKGRVRRIVGKRKEKVERKEKKERNRGKEKKGRSEWKEQVVRVGTGYRVRKDEKDPRTRRFDVGYADRKRYKRKPGREAVVDQSSMGRTVVGKGEKEEEVRVRVMNAVCAMEKRRPVSEYTGSGIRRKARVGKRKLKPTKPQAKQ